VVNIYKHAFTCWHRPGIEPGTFWFQVGHSNHLSMPPYYYHSMMSCVGAAILPVLHVLCILPHSLYLCSTAVQRPCCYVISLCCRQFVYRWSVGSWLSTLQVCELYMVVCKTRHFIFGYKASQYSPMLRQKAECFFWYRPTRVVPERRPLNGSCCIRPRKKYSWWFTITWTDTAGDWL